MSKYSKFMVAVVGVAITWLVASWGGSETDTITRQEWLAGLVAVATALGVYQARNDPS